jgi:hypothetical protein
VDQLVPGVTAAAISFFDFLFASLSHPADANATYVILGTAAAHFHPMAH